MNSVIPKGYKKTWIPKELKTPDNYKTNPKFENEYFSIKQTKRLLYLEKKLKPVRRSLNLEEAQVNGLDKCLFISSIKQGHGISAMVNGASVNVNEFNSSSDDEFRAIVKVQGLNREFKDKEALELWLLRRYQLTTFKQRQEQYEKERIWLKSMLDLLDEKF